MNGDAPNARKDTASHNSHRLTAPLLLGAPKIGDAARNAVLWGFKKYGVSGTGVPIAQLWGVTAHRAAMACAGGGPLSLGGSGIAGGDARLGLVKAGTVIAISAVALGLTVREQMRIAAASGQSARDTKSCESCRGSLAGASGDLDNFHDSALCPRFENGDIDEA